MWYGSAESVGRASIFWACTDGGAKRFGQIFRYFPDTDEVELFIEPNDDSLLKNADNITIAPWGDLFICEDTKGFNHLRGVTPEGQLYTLARNAQKNGEFAGACMNADGSVLFVNLQAEGLTLAITGPWDAA
jgi:secreted PhoX family phosphatase